MTKETTRVLELLKRFNDGQTVCIEQLLKDPVWFNDTKGEQMSEKSIRRDLDVLKEKFPESFELIRGGKGEKGCYRAITKQTFENILTPEMVSLLVLTFNIAQKSDLFDNLNLSAEDKKILDNKIKEFNRAYEFKKRTNRKTLMTKETTRVLELLKRFNDGQTVCIVTGKQIGRAHV